MTTQQADKIQQQHQEAGAGSQAPVLVERMPRQRETIVVESAIPTLDTAMFEHMQRIAKMMASSSLVPAHLNAVRRVDGQDVAIEPQEAVANCFLVVNQAIRWRMDPFAVAQHVYTTKGRIGYEGKLIAAIINSHPAIEKRLTYGYSGQGEARKVVVTAKLKGDDQPVTIEGTVKDWRTDGKGSPWGNANQHDQMLSYRGAREWARRWLPEAVLGVWGDDEIASFEASERTLPGQEERPQEQRRGAAGLKAALQATDAQVVAETKREDKPVEQNAAAQTQSVNGIAGSEKPAAGAASAAPDPKAKEEPTDFSDKARESKPSKRAQEPKAKPAGTREQLAKYIEQFARCKDAETLALARDEANMYAWTDEHKEALDVAYSQRQDALKAA